LTPPRPTFAEQLTPAAGQFLEVVLHHLAFVSPARRRATFTPPGRSVQNATLGEDRHCLQPDHVAGTAGHVDFACGDHGGDAAVKVAVDPALWFCCGVQSTATGGRAVDQARSDRRPVGIDDGGGAFGIDVL